MVKTGGKLLGGNVEDAHRVSSTKPHPLARNFASTKLHSLFLGIVVAEQNVVNPTAQGKTYLKYTFRALGYTVVPSKTSLT